MSYVIEQESHPGPIMTLTVSAFVPMPLHLAIPPPRRGRDGWGGSPDQQFVQGTSPPPRPSPLEGEGDLTVSTRPSIVVLGSLNVDLVTHVPALPRPGETVLGDRLRTFAGGKGANQAVAAARLGGRVAMIGRVGGDGGGDSLLRQLERDGVDTAGVERDGQEPTGAALIMVGAGGENLIAVAPGANGRVGAADVERALSAAGPGGLLVLQLEIPMEAAAHALRGAASRGRRAVLNAAPAAALAPEL